MTRLPKLLVVLCLMPSLALGQGRGRKAAPDSQPGLTPTPFNLDLSNEAVEGAWRPRLTTSQWPGFTFTPSLRAGMMALSESMTTPYAILLPSPYLSGGLSLVYTGALEFAAIGNLSAANIESRKYFTDPAGGAASSASQAPTQTRFSEQFQGTSGYADLGKVVSLSDNVKAAFFAAAAQWNLEPRRGGYGAAMTEYNAGTMWMLADRENRFSVFGDVRVEPARTAFYRNAAAEYEWVPSHTLGGEYARKLGGSEVRVGVETSVSRADTATRPYIGFSSGKIDTLAAGNLRQSNDRFYPDVKGGGVTVDAEVARGLRLGITGSVNSELYSMAPAPVTNSAVTVGLTWRLDDDLTVKSAYLYKQAQARSSYTPSRSDAMNGRLPGAGYASVFRSALLTSSTFGEFVKKIPVTGTDQLLSALSAFSQSVGTFNYNYDESVAKPNLESIDEIYRRARASHLANRQDPILVCMGEAQFTAVLAQALGRQAGLNIQASATTVVVSGKDGARGGHAVAMVKTPQYGIVFVDWGRLTPTHTFSTKEALRIYQALQGIPNLYHHITDADGNGRHVGYLFTEEGKQMVRRLTYHADAPSGELNRMFDDEPRSEQVTVERYRTLLKKAFGR